MKELPKDVPLFRHEAVQHRTDAIFGGVMLPDSRLQNVLVTVALLLIGCLFVCITVGVYPRHVPAYGWINTVPGLARVLSPRQGIVSPASYKEGDSVEAGREVLTISANRASLASPDVDRDILANMRTETEMLVRQETLEREMTATRAAHLRRSIADGEVAITDLKASLEILRRKQALAEAERRRTASLVEKGLLSTAAAEKGEEAVLASALEVAAMSQRVRERQAALDLARQDLRQSLPELEGKLGELSNRRSALEQRLAQLEGDRVMSIRAPVSGRISSIAFYPGQTVVEGAPLFVIIPDGASMRAELLVPARAIGKLEPGMGIRLRYDAYPFQVYGQHSLKVDEIGNSPLIPGDQLGPYRIEEPVYKIVANLKQSTVGVQEKEIRLRPGLTVTAEIVYDKRRLIEWLLSPIIAVRARFSEEQ